MGMSVSRSEVEDFLYHEYELLDKWDLEKWADLFTEDGHYFVPPTDDPHADYKSSLFIIADDHHRIVQRAKRLLKKEAHVEFPHSTTRHLISNVRIKDIENEVIKVTCNFITYRTKREVLDPYVGHIKYLLVRGDDSFKIKEKRVILDLDALRPQGKVSIIL